MLHYLTKKFNSDNAKKALRTGNLLVMFGCSCKRHWWKHFRQCEAQT